MTKYADKKNYPNYPDVEIAIGQLLKAKHQKDVDLHIDGQDILCSRLADGYFLSCNLHPSKDVCGTRLLQYNLLWSMDNDNYLGEMDGFIKLFQSIPTKAIADLRKYLTEFAHNASHWQMIAENTSTESDSRNLSHPMQTHASFL